MDNNTEPTPDQEYEKLAQYLHRNMRVSQVEYIICAANWYNTGIKKKHQPKNIETGFVVCGRRHHNCFITTFIINEDYARDIKRECEQGFLTSKDRWVTREEAGKLAFEAGQIKKETKCLFSEDLY